MSDTATDTFTDALGRPMADSTPCSECGGTHYPGGTGWKEEARYERADPGRIGVPCPGARNGSSTNDPDGTERQQQEGAAE